MKSTFLILLTCLTLAAGTTTIRVTTPAWARYKTVDSTGLVEFWASKPYILYLDTVPPTPFCWWSDSAEDFGLYEAIETGVTNKNWTRSCRKLK